MRGKLIFKGGRTAPAPLQALTLTVQPPTDGVVGEAVIPFNIVFQNAVGTVNLNAVGLPTGLIVTALTATTFRVSGTYSAAGTFPVVLTGTDQANGHQASASFTTIVAATPSGLVVPTGQVLPFGSLTPAGQSGIAPTFSGTGLANAVINLQDGGAVTHFQVDPATAVVTPKAGATLVAGVLYILTMSFTGQDASVVNNRDVGVQVETVPGRSAGILSELNSAVAAWTSGTNIYLRGGAAYGDPTSVVSKLFTAASYVTKHTNQAVLPEIGKWWMGGGGVNNIRFTWIDFHWEGGSMDGTIAQPAHRLGPFNDLRFAECIFRGKEDFDPLTPFTTSHYWTSLGVGLSSFGVCANFWVERCRFKNLWMAIWTAVAPVGGVQVFHDNWIGPTAGTQSYIAFNKGTHTSLSYCRNYHGGACSGTTQAPALSHTNHTFFIAGEIDAAGWAIKNIEVSQNIFNKEFAPGSPKGIFFQGKAWEQADESHITTTVEDWKCLDNLVIGSSYYGIQGPWMSGENNVIAGNTIANWDPDDTVFTPHNIFQGFAHPPLDPGSVQGKVKMPGNIFPDVMPATFSKGMQVIGLSTNLITGQGASNYPGRWADIFAGGATMRPSTRAEALACVIPKVPGPADGNAGLGHISPAPGAISGHHVFPTAALSPAGASQVDQTGAYWGV